MDRLKDLVRIIFIFLIIVEDLILFLNQKTFDSYSTNVFEDIFLIIDNAKWTAKQSSKTFW